MGDAEKLNNFLELNPKIARDMIFVDGANGLTTFPAYDAAGLGSLDNLMKDQEKTKDASKKIGAPNLGGPRAWFKYIRNVTRVSPIGRDGSTEGVKRLGGQFVLNGNDVVYAYADPLPGVEAPVEELVAAAGA